MGITIHYSGKIKHTRLIEPLTHEVKDICESFDWKYQEIDMELGVGGLVREETSDTPQIYVKGLTFTPPECEAFNFLFMENGNMVSIIKVLTDIDTDDIETGQWISTKTQFAGADIHITVSKLLKYLSEKYLEKFEVLDEGHFWGIEDEAKTRATFQQYDNAINTFTNALENFKGAKPETKEDLIKQIEHILKDLRKKGEL